MPSSNGSIRTWIFGGITLVSVSVVFWYILYGRNNKPKQIKEVDDKSSTKSQESLKESKKIIVEDVEESEQESDEEEESSSEDEEEEDDTKEKNDEEPIQLEVKNVAKSENGQIPSANSTTTAPTEAKAKGIESPEKNEAALLKDQYDAAVRLGQKLISGGLNERAVEKLTEAITLALKVPSAQKDILTLYNNRSAMYEKLGQFDNSIRDINIVLTMDPFHGKARIRRARVLESQGKPLQSLQDYVIATLLERARGIESSYDRKINELSKRVAIERTPKTLTELRSTQKQRSIPSKAYCRNFFEAYPNSYAWKQAFYGVNREELASKYQQHRIEAQSSQSKSQEKQFVNSWLESCLDLVKYDLAHESYKKAFETLHDLPLSSLDASFLNKTLASVFHELLGTELHLKFQMQEALKQYESAINFYPANISAQLKYNSVLLENGDRDQALASYTNLLGLLLQSTETAAASAAAVAAANNDEDGDFDKVQVSSLSDKNSEDDFADARASPVSLTLDQETKEVKVSYLSWVYNHRASLWVSRDENGSYAPNAFDNAIADLDESLKQSANVMHLAEGKGAHFIALLKSVQLRTHTKQTMEIPVTESDSTANRMAIQSAKNLFPDHESVLLLEVEQLAFEGNTEDASKLVDKAARSGNYDEFIIVNLQATILTNQAFAALQVNPTDAEQLSYAQRLFEEVSQLYQKALELDAESLEVKAQYAQLKSMMFGDLPGAIALLKDSLAIARSRDEVQDLLAMLVNNEAQAFAIEEIRKAQQ